ncbi:MAG: hypothetical protein JO356_08535 [Acidobacteria bacterium]|nr:hypothetical protein [Acidobacteriota bacterium]
MPYTLLAVCLAGLVVRRRKKQLPIFVLYIVCQLTVFLSSITTSLLTPRVSLNTYHWVMTLGMAVGLLLELCVLYELANELMVSQLSSAPMLRRGLRWTAAILILVATAASASFPQPGLHRVVKLFQILDFSSNLIEIGLLLGLLLFSRILGVAWRSLPAGIALGFGLYASAQIAASSLLLLLGRPGYVTVDLVRMAAFHVCVLVWLFYIFSPIKAPIITGAGLREVELESWGQKLGRMVH